MYELYNGECLEVMKGIEGGSVDLVLTDPPYGTTQNKWDSVIDLQLMWKELSRIVKPKGVIVFTASQPFTSVLICSNLDDFKCEWIWKKNAGSNFGSVKYQPMKEHESVLVFAKKTPTYNPQMQERSEAGKKAVKRPIRSNTKSSSNYGEFGETVSVLRDELRFPSSVQNFNRERGLHPTQKPVALMEYLVKTYSNELDTVLDFTMGSGTAGVACKNLGRKFIGIELDENYFQIAKERIEVANE
jgi:site-specific DNA-methyltransferase (adenine-specific)